MKAGRHRRGVPRGRPDREGDGRGIARRPDAPGRIRRGQAGDHVAYLRPPHGVGLRILRRNRQQQGKLRIAGDALVLAHQPFGGDLELDIRAGHEVRRGGDRDRQEEVAVVAVAYDVPAAVREKHGGGPLDFACLPAERQRPFERRREPGARVDPVGVPVRLVDKVQRDVEGRARMDRRVCRDKRRGNLRPRRLGQRRGEEGQCGQGGGEEALHGVGSRRQPLSVAPRRPAASVQPFFAPAAIHRSSIWTSSVAKGLSPSLGIESSSPGGSRSLRRISLEPGFPGTSAGPSSPPRINCS